MACCCPPKGAAAAGVTSKDLPLICMVPRDGGIVKSTPGSSKPHSAATGSPSDRGEVHLLDEEYIRKHFKLPPTPLYLDPFRRPLITFPMNQGETNNFNMFKKNKINQMILDGILDPSAAVKAPSIFPFASEEEKKKKAAEEEEEDEEIVYILQLPDWEFKCPLHNETIRTPRFMWHSCKKPKKSPADKFLTGGPSNKPKPWLISRHTDFDLLSQW